MKKRAGIEKQNQEKPIAMTIAMQQLMLPLWVAMDATKKGLLAFVQQMGMVALSELLAFEAAQIAGPKGKHNDGRTHHPWGAASTPMCFGGRNVSIAHRRVRARGKGRDREVTLPSLEALREGDPLSARVAEQIVLGVSTRGYERSLDPIDESINARGTSKSNASRALIETTAEKLAEFVSCKLDDVDLVAMFIDGIEFAGRTVIIALGVTIDGTKLPLGLWACSTVAVERPPVSTLPAARRPLSSASPTRAPMLRPAVRPEAVARAAWRRRGAWVVKALASWRSLDGTRRNEAARKAKIDT